MTAVPVPLLADFVIRLSFGILIACLLIPWRDVPPPFFRTLAQIALALLVLGALAQTGSGSRVGLFWVTLAAAFGAYLASISWGLGVPRIAAKVTAAVALCAAVWLIAVSVSSGWRVTSINASSRLASGIFLGVTLAAMLLGHYYLTAPAMSIEPLRRAVAWIAAALVARCVLAGIALVMSDARWGVVIPAQAGTQSGLFMTARWGMGFLGTAVATFLTWRTVRIRSTQSATGILYITMIFVLFGELTALILAANSGILC
jgi:hypothetical protein